MHNQRARVGMLRTQTHNHTPQQPKMISGTSGRRLEEVYRRLDATHPAAPEKHLPISTAAYKAPMGLTALLVFAGGLASGLFIRKALR